MKKNRFFGKYYKFISDDGYTFALIISKSNEGDMLQLITPDKGYFISDTNSVVIKDNIIDININQDDISLKGNLSLGKFHPLSKKVMGPFTYLPMECRHDIYSMYHSINGNIIAKGIIHKFTNSLGYIEGDSGKNFPKKYIWYNSLTNKATLTLAIATIPLFGFIKFTGLLCFIKGEGFEYRFATYNRGKIVKKTEQQIIIKKNKYILTIDIHHIGGHMLKAPMKGDMTRYIKENINVATHYKLTYKDEIILEVDDPLSSLEYMY